MKQSILLILWMTVVFSAAGQSRGKSAMFFGHVVDSKGISVEYATIILLQDSVQKAGAVADSSGGFRMEAQAGSYDLVAQCVGYESLHKKVSLPLSESATLVLATSSLALNEVVVQARSIERKADRFVMPLSLLYIGIGVSITGIILQERCMIYTPLVAFVIAFYMLGVLAVPNITPDIWWNLYFGIAIILMQIVPGHVLNCKAKKVCSKN